MARSGTRRAYQLSQGNNQVKNPLVAFTIGVALAAGAGAADEQVRTVDDTSRRSEIIVHSPCKRALAA